MTRTTMMAMTITITAVTMMMANVPDIVCHDCYDGRDGDDMTVATTITITSVRHHDDDGSNDDGDRDRLVGVFRCGVSWGWLMDCQQD
jgi:hypothetical protein